MAFGDDDLNMMMAANEFDNVAITYGSPTQTAYGKFNRGASLAPQADGTVLNVQESTVDIQTGDLTSVRQSQAITVNSISYIIADHQPMDDGKITRIWLSA